MMHRQSDGYAFKNNDLADTLNAIDDMLSSICYKTPYETMT